MCTRNVQIAVFVRDFVQNISYIKMHKQLLHVIIYGYLLLVRKGFQKALPWLMCSYQSFLNITHVFELRDVLELMGFSLQIHVRLNQIHRIEQQKKRNEIHHIWKMMLMLLFCRYTLFPSAPCAHMCQFLEEHTISQGNRRSTMI